MLRVCVWQHFPDMRTAFPLKLDLPDLTHEDMAHLIMKTAKARGYRLEKSVESQLPRIIRDSHTSADARAYNSILAGSVLSKAIQAQAARARRKYPALASKKSSSSLLATLTVGDFTTSQDSSPPVPESAEEVLAELDHVRWWGSHVMLSNACSCLTRMHGSQIVGLDSVKNHVRQLHASAIIDRQRRAAGLGLKKRTSSRSLHMVFEGNPGTGKSTVALVIAKLFKQMGLLKHGQLVNAKRSDLVAEYVSVAAPRDAACRAHKPVAGAALTDTWAKPRTVPWTLCIAPWAECS